MSNKKKETAAEEEISDATENETEAVEGEVLEAEEETSEEETSEEENAEDESEAEELSDLEVKDKEIERLTAELQVAKDMYVRNHAELENFKRRKTEEAKERLKYASSGMARDLIQGLDNLELALSHANPEEDEQFKNFVQGIEMVKGQLAEALKKNNVERIDPTGEAFDPNRHEAVGMVDKEGVEDGAVAEVLQAGYLLHDRVIRPAMVQVCKKS
ncbi:MAG: nucleotide exchange factor GrpE [SAR324 cluster bacterium]|nr:nucleotide exchange factor GrpE [SAR324 cluster bacterium]